LPDFFFVVAMFLSVWVPEAEYIQQKQKIQQVSRA
jgi:hypothetical protein